MTLNMTYTETGPDKDAASKKAWRENNKERHALTNGKARNDARSMRGFVGVDGEGTTVWCEHLNCSCPQYAPISGEDSPCKMCKHKKDSHYHAYVLLGIGDQHIDTEMLGIDEIGWEEAFEFLYSEFLRPANRYKVFCGFALGYDFTQIFKSFSRYDAWKLYNARGNLHSENERGDNDRRPVSSRKPTIATRELQSGKGKPWPVRITGKRGAWEFDTLDERQLRLRPFNCGCAEEEYHREHCDSDTCVAADHHLSDKLCHWRDGECNCDDKGWHLAHCKLVIKGNHLKKFHHSTEGCTRRAETAVKEPEWMYINDVFSYFQKSFLSVINPEDWADKKCAECMSEPCITHNTTECIQRKECKPAACQEHRIVTRAEYLTIKRGKEDRSNAVLDDDMRHYNQLENIVLSRVMSKFQQGLTRFNVHLRIDQWYGPGQAAGEWINSQGQKAACAPHNGRHGTVRRVDNPLTRKIPSPHDMLGTIVERAARASFIAGWFETFAHGHVSGTSYEYDINSAYPDVIKDLPCMAHGKWEAGYSGGTKLRSLPKGAAFRLIHATVSGKDPHIGAMLHRKDDDNICRPHVTHSWYWQDELEAAIAAGLIDTVEIGCVEDGCREFNDDTGRSVPLYNGALTLTYFPDKVCGYPLAGMAELYLERLKAGKNSPMGKAAKLVYNSVYGKFAQLVGSPQWGSNIYASRITSGCRKKILGAIATHPEGSKAVVMIATDGIYFTSKHPTLPVSDDVLGLWEMTPKEHLTLFKPGVYWDDEARAQIKRKETPKFKSRGVSARKFSTEIANIDAMYDAWNGQFPTDETSWPSVEFDAGFSMTSAKQALMRGKWETTGDVKTSGKLTQNSFPDGKRNSVVVYDETGELSRPALRIVGEYDTEYGLYRSNPIEVSYIVSKPRDENQAVARMRDNGELDDSYTRDGTVTNELAWALGIR